MTARPPQGGEDLGKRTEDAEVGATNPGAGPVVVWGIIIAAAAVFVTLAVIGLGIS